MNNIQTVTVHDAVSRLRYAARQAQRDHVQAVAAGGYNNPYEDVADYDPTDPVLITKERWALNLTLAADLLEMHDGTNINLNHWATAHRFVSMTMTAEGITAPIVGDH